jgi:hypothetical protein
MEQEGFQSLASPLNRPARQDMRVSVENSLTFFFTGIELEPELAVCEFGCNFSN